MTLDFARPVVLALHYQNDVLHADGKFQFGAAGNAEARERVVQAASALMALARRRAWPIVHVRIAYREDHSDVRQNCRIFRTVVAQGAMKEGGWGAQFLQPLGPVGGEPVVTHQRINAFYGSALDTLLQSLDASVLIVAGVATNSVVEHTVRHATDMGHESLVLADACAAASQGLHDGALENLRLVAEVATLAELERLVGPRSAAGEPRHV